MLQSHGLFIPDRNRLVIDEVTLVKYSHLIIFGYFECLYCGSERSSAQATQQHMIGKGHCKIDVYRENSEFRDFYNFDSGYDFSCNSDGSGDHVAKPPASPLRTIIKKMEAKTINGKSVGPDLLEGRQRCGCIHAHSGTNDSR